MRLSRRQLYGAGAGTAGAGLLAAGMAATGRASQDQPEEQPDDKVPFHGPQQAGILTPVQDRMHFAAFDVADGMDRDRLVLLLRDWTEAAALMVQGLPAGSAGGAYDMPPADTGEAIDLPASHLTITFGFGPSLFRDGAGADRFGLAARQPDPLKRLPHFVGDNLTPDASDGDLCVQACADDPQVAVHAVRQLTRMAFGRATLRWSQLGYGRTSSTSVTQNARTERNLLGFKDGTMGIRAEETEDVTRNVLVPESEGRGWLGGGSYLVARKIRMHIETWDRASLREQERVVGRTKAEGAPLSGGEEFSQPDFDLKGRGGIPLVDRHSHVGIAHPVHNNGVRMLRRGYNYVDGNDTLGRLSAGLFFIAFVTNPETHYIPMQSKMSRHDLMQEYVQHIGSGLWAVPPGISEGEFVGQALFD